MARLRTRLKRIESNVSAHTGRTLVFFEDPHDPPAATLRGDRVLFGDEWIRHDDLPADVTAILVRYTSQ